MSHRIEQITVVHSRVSYYRDAVFGMPASAMTGVESTTTTDPGLLLFQGNGHQGMTAVLGTTRSGLAGTGADSSTAASPGQRYLPRDCQMHIAQQVGQQPAALPQRIPEEGVLYSSSDTQGSC